MAGGKDRRRCVFQFTVEWAMWGNVNALYSAVRKLLSFFFFNQFVLFVFANDLKTNSLVT